MHRAGRMGGRDTDSIYAGSEEDWMWTCTSAELLWIKTARSSLFTECGFTPDCLQCREHGASLSIYMPWWGASTHLPTGPLGPAECLLNLHLRMQVRQDSFLRDLARLLDLELLLDGQAALTAGHVQHRTLHQRVHHAVLDGLAARGHRTRVDEQQRRGLAALVLVGEAVECESRLAARYGLDELWYGRGRRGVGDELDLLGVGVDFLAQDRLSAPLLLLLLLFFFLLLLLNARLTSITRFFPPSPASSFRLARASSPTGMVMVWPMPISRVPVPLLPSSASACLTPCRLRSSSVRGASSRSCLSCRSKPAGLSSSLVVAKMVSRKCSRPSSRTRVRRVEAKSIFWRTLAVSGTYETATSLGVAS